MRRTAVLVAGVALLASAACSGGAAPQGSVGAQASAPASSAPASSAPAREGAPSRLAFRGCGGGFSCATLPVPLVDGDPSQGTVPLAVVRRPAEDPEARLGSLVVNPGGPGSSAVEYLRLAHAALPEQVRERFDLVAFDPRGVGKSAPVRCATTAELDRYFALDPSPDDAAELTAYQRGNRALAQGCQRRSGRLLPHVSTERAAADMERLRVALGEDRLDYLGYSYGTAIGAEYLQRHPTRVRTMVLDGPLDPALTWDALVEGQSRGFDRALLAFLDDCERTRCAFRRAVQGELLAAFDRLAQAVERSRLPTGDGRGVGPGEFSLGVGAGLYSREQGWPAVAAALSTAADGDGSALLALSDSYLERRDDGYANVSEANLAVNCLDRAWPRDPQPYLDLAERVRGHSPRFGPAIALSGLACAYWPVPPADRPAPVTAPQAPPVLVIGTTRDPATPYEWAVAVSEQLETSVLLTLDGDGHTVYRAGGPKCVVDRVDAYLLTGQAPEPVRC